VFKFHVINTFTLHHKCSVVYCLPADPKQTPVQIGYFQNCFHFGDEFEFILPNALQISQINYSQRLLLY